MHLQIKQADIGYHQPLISNAEASLKSGEVCLLIGNNGVGKTTLIKSLLHQVPLLNGEILLGGRSVTEFSAREIAEHIAVVYSKSVLPRHHTVEDLIALGKYIYYPYYFELKRKDREEISHTIDMLGMDRYRHTSLINLSDGNLQKAFIGRAITQNSQLSFWMSRPPIWMKKTKSISCKPFAGWHMNRTKLSCSLPMTGGWQKNLPIRYGT